jgi:hypothetical protein
MLVKYQIQNKMAVIFSKIKIRKEYLIVKQVIIVSFSALLVTGAKESRLGVGIFS